MMKRIVGLMSGTSADGVTAALVQVSGTDEKTRLEILAWDTFPYKPAFRRKIFQLFSPRTGTVDRICRVNFALGEKFAKAALRIAEKAGLDTKKIDMIASHGQTIYHIPSKPRSTLQICQGAVIAERTGITTVSDFRARDVATGGQGAPLVALADLVLFRNAHRARAIQNIGGIANVTVVPRSAKLSDVFAFDTGPGNVIVDSVVRQLTKGRLLMDRNGMIAKTGKIDHKVLRDLMKSPFIRKKPPKTTGREEFGEEFAEKYLKGARSRGLRREDIVATATAFTAESIAYNYRRFVYPRCRIDEVVLGGGGAKNPTLVNLLRERLDLPVLFHEDFGIPSEAKEAIAFAILGNQIMEGKPGNVPSATGASRAVLLGAIWPGGKRTWRPRTG